MSTETARLARFVHLFLYALVAGVFWGTWFSLSRSIASTDGDAGPMAVVPVRRRHSAPV